MNKKLTAILTMSIISFFLLVPLKPVATATVFSENFSSGNFVNWSQAYLSPGSSQTVTDGAAHFIVPAPTGDSNTYSFVAKDGFSSTVNSTIVASQDIMVAKVPSGCPQGMGAIFFLYVCDTTDLRGNNGNFGVGIDGSGVWSLWIGGNSIYTYVFQTSGSAPASNTWFHVTLTISNSAGTASLTVNGETVITAAQQQFTDRTHAITLMSGMGEDWWRDGPRQQEIGVDEVKLDISDSPAPSSDHGPTLPPPAPTTTPNYNPTPPPTPTHTATLHPNSTTVIPPSTPSPSPSSKAMQPGSGVSFELNIAEVAVFAVLIAVSIIMLRHKR